VYGTVVLAILQVDRLSGWKPCHNAPFAKAYKQQSMHAQNAFNVKLNEVVKHFSLSIVVDNFGCCLPP